MTHSTEYAQGHPERWSDFAHHRAELVKARPKGVEG